MPLSEIQTGTLSKEAERRLRLAEAAHTAGSLDEAARDADSACAVLTLLYETGDTPGHFRPLCRAIEMSCAIALAAMKREGGNSAAAEQQCLVKATKLHSMAPGLAQKLAVQAHDTAMEYFKKVKPDHRRAGQFGLAAEHLGASDPGQLTNCGAFISHRALVEQAPDARKECLDQAKRVWQNVVQSRPGYTRAHLSLCEQELLCESFPSAANRVAALWKNDQLTEPERTICAWLGGMASVLCDAADSTGQQFLEHLESRSPSAALGFWQTTEIDALLAGLPPDLEARARPIHDRFLALKEPGT